MKCFFISPIGSKDSPIREKADKAFESIVEPAMVKCGITVLRADKLKKPGKITEQMFEEIRQSTLCIVDITGGNPNVFYELGIAQMLNKPVIIIKEIREVIPFDLKDHRYIEYDTNSVDDSDIDTIVKYVDEFKSMNWIAKPLFKSDAEYIYIEKIETRTALYQKATEMIGKAKKIMDTTWGKMANEMTKEEKAARDEYRLAIRKAIERKAVYKDIYSYNEKWEKEYQQTTTRFKKTSQYEARYLYGLDEEFPVIDCMITDQHEVLLSHVSFEGIVEVPVYLFMRSENVASFYTALFEDCWRYAKQQKQRRGANK